MSDSQQTWKPDFGLDEPAGNAKPDKVWRPDDLDGTSSSTGNDKPNATGPTGSTGGSSNNASSNNNATNGSNNANPNGSSVSPGQNSTGTGTNNNTSSNTNGSTIGTSTNDTSKPTTGNGSTADTSGDTSNSAGGMLQNADPWKATDAKKNDKGFVPSPARGGTGGTPFSDASYVTSPQTSTITAVKLNYNTGIDRIQICYGGKWADAHGGSAGLKGLSEETFYLQRGESIVQIDGRSGTKIDSLQFTTSSGRKSKVYGGSGGYSFSWSGSKLGFIAGRAGDQVDNLQSYWIA